MRRSAPLCWPTPHAHGLAISTTLCSPAASAPANASQQSLAASAVEAGAGHSSAHGAQLDDAGEGRTSVTGGGACDAAATHKLGIALLNSDFHGAVDMILGCARNTERAEELAEARGVGGGAVSDGARDLLTMPTRKRSNQPCN